LKIRPHLKQRVWEEGDTGRAEGGEKSLKKLRKMPRERQGGKRFPARKGRTSLAVQRVRGETSVRTSGILSRQYRDARKKKQREKIVGLAVQGKTRKKVTRTIIEKIGNRTTFLGEGMKNRRNEKV